MKTFGVFVLGILLGFTLPATTPAQVFFNSDHNSGMAVEVSPGITWYSDRTKSGFIVETMPGQVMYNLTGQNGQPGQFGFATDLTPRYTPSVDPMVDTLMPPLPKGATIYDLPSERPPHP